MCSLPIASPRKLDMVLNRDGTKSHMQTQPFKTVSSGLCEVRNISSAPVVGNADETLWILEDGQRIWSGTRPDLAEQIGRSAKGLSLTRQEFREMWQSWTHAIHINIRGDIAAKRALTPMLTFRILFLYSLLNLSFFFKFYFETKPCVARLVFNLLFTGCWYASPYPPCTVFSPRHCFIIISKWARFQTSEMTSSPPHRSYCYPLLPFLWRNTE